MKVGCGDFKKKTLTPLDILKTLKVKNLEHSNGFLYDHLINTCQILYSWDCPRDVCLGGLIHSIYGTKWFSQKNVDLLRREYVAKIVGLVPERLAYLNCILPTDELKKLNFVSRSTCSVFSPMEKKLVYVCFSDICDLVTIQFANTFEQLERLNFNIDDLYHEFNFIRSFYPLVNKRIFEIVRDEIYRLLDKKAPSPKIHKAITGKYSFSLI